MKNILATMAVRELVPMAVNWWRNRGNRVARVVKLSRKMGLRELHECAAYFKRRYEEELYWAAEDEFEDMRDVQ